MKKLSSTLALITVAFACFSQPLFASDSAIHCVAIERNDYGGANIVNHCGFPVEAFWCVENLDCKHGTWGMTNQWAIRAGGQYPVSGSKGKNVFAFACDKPNASIIEQGPNQFGCKD